MSESYTIKKGDSLWSIAKKHDVTLGELLNSNPQFLENGRNPDLVFPGEEVSIPSNSNFSPNNNLETGCTDCQGSSIQEALTREEILADLNVQNGLRQAWEDSNDGGANDHEEGGYIVRDSDSTLDIVRLPEGEEDSMEPDLYPSGEIDGKEIVGFFHTHPNTGTEFQDEPSDADIGFTTDNPETVGGNHFVITPNDVYHIDDTGNVETVGALNEVIGE